MGNTYTSPLENIEAPIADDNVLCTVEYLDEEKLREECNKCNINVSELEKEILGKIEACILNKSVLNVKNLQELDIVLLMLENIDVGKYSKPNKVYDTLDSLKNQLQKIKNNHLLFTNIATAALKQNTTAASNNKLDTLADALAREKLEKQQQKDIRWRSLFNSVANNANAKDIIINWRDITESDKLVNQHIRDVDELILDYAQYVDNYLPNNTLSGDDIKLRLKSIRDTLTTLLLLIFKIQMFENTRDEKNHIYQTQLDNYVDN